MFKELLLPAFALGCKIDQRLKNEQIYYVGHITVITHIYFDFSGCRKGDQCFTSTHLHHVSKIIQFTFIAHAFYSAVKNVKLSLA